MRANRFAGLSAESSPSSIPANSTGSVVSTAWGPYAEFLRSLPSGQSVTVSSPAPAAINPAPASFVSLSPSQYANAGPAVHAVNQASDASQSVTTDTVVAGGSVFTDSTGKPVPAPFSGGLSAGAIVAFGAFAALFLIGDK